MTRAREWDGVVSCHMGHDSAQTWDLHNGCIGKHALTSKHVSKGARPQVGGAWGWFWSCDSSGHYNEQGVWYGLVMGQKIIMGLKWSCDTRGHT